MSVVCLSRPPPVLSIRTFLSNFFVECTTQRHSAAVSENMLSPRFYTDCMLKSSHALSPLAYLRRRRREPLQVRSKFLTTSWMLRLFSAGVQAPPKGARVVYIDGEANNTRSMLCQVAEDIGTSALYRTISGLSWSILSYNMQLEYSAPHTVHS